MLTLVRAQLVAGNMNLVLPVNPYTANWGYQENVTSQDTIGGRVVQLLSVQVQDITVTSVAGSRSELQKIADGVSEIMKYHVKTSLPARFKVPSRRWDFRVYLTSMPQIGWDVASTTYPYEIGMAVQEDVSRIKSAQILRNELSRLREGIGYQEEFHGGDVKGFQKIVNSVLKAAGPLDTTGLDGGFVGSPGNYQGTTGLWNPDIANAPWEGKTIRDQIYNAWAAVFGVKVAKDSLCIAERESGFRPTAYNDYRDKEGVLHYVYGLFQISDAHKASPWFPKGGVHGTEGGLLYDPEYNTRSAMQIYKGQGWGPWTVAAECL